MSPPRRAPSGGMDLLERLEQKMDRLESELSDLKEMLANRLTKVEQDAAKVSLLEVRVVELEKVNERAKGAAMLGRALWAVLLAVGGALGWVASRFLGHP